MIAALMLFLKGLFGWALGGFVQRIFVGAGISFVTYSVMDTVVQGFLDQIIVSLNSLPASTVAILRMMGIGDALSIIGSAMLTVAALRAAGQILGAKVTT